MRRQIERFTAPLKARVANMLARAVIETVNDALGIQGVQLSVLDGELVDDAERMQDYGFTSVPHPGAEAVLAFPGGLRSHALVVAVGDRRYRLKGLQGGEVAIYDDQEQSIILKRDGLYIASAQKIEAEAPRMTFTATEQFKVVSPHVLLESDKVDLGAEGGKKVGRHDDAIVAGKVLASTEKVYAA